MIHKRGQNASSARCPVSACWVNCYNLNEYDIAVDHITLTVDNDHLDYRLNDLMSDKICSVAQQADNCIILPDAFTEPSSSVKSSLKVCRYT